MARQVVPLSALKVKQVKAAEKEQNLFDGGGLYLHIPSAKYDKSGQPLPAAKWWRLKYRYQGKASKISLGTYPAVSLEEARKKRQEVKEMIANGINPSEEKRRQRAIISLQDELNEYTLETISEQWFDMACKKWVPGHTRTVRSRLDRDILPVLGHMPISDISAQDVLATLRLVEKRQAYETAHRIKSILNQIFTFAIVSGVPGVINNPTAGLSSVLHKPVVKHMAAILEPGPLGQLMRDIDEYQGAYVVKCSLKLTPMLFVRPGELRSMKWEDIDYEVAQWKIPVADMKMSKREKEQRKGHTHTVPLARQTIEVLQELQMLTGRGRYVFPGRAGRPISNNTVNAALRTMGWGKDQVTAHGFRATARTMLHETLGFSPDAIEAQLAHNVPDRLGGAYNRTQHLEERTRMMQAWADYLDGLK